MKVILSHSQQQHLIEKRLQISLFNYRNTIHCTTGYSPAQLFIGRPLRCRLYLLRPPSASVPVPDTSSVSTAKHKIVSKQISQHKYYGGKRQCFFQNEVLIKTFYNNGMKYTWVRGTVVKKIGTRMYIVFIEQHNCEV